MYKKLRTVFAGGLVCFALLGCGHEHVWKEATCTEPKTCSECGETEGEALGHDWKEATCTEPMTCARCGDTQGDPNPHSTDMGICQTCGKAINFDTFKQFSDEISKIKASDNGIMVNAKTLDGMYNGATKIYTETITAIDSYQKIYDNYKDYEGISSVINYIDDAIKAKPSKPQKSKESLISFAEEMTTFQKKQLKIAETMSNKINEFLDASGH